MVRDGRVREFRLQQEAGVPLGVPILCGHLLFGVSVVLSGWVLIFYT